MNITELKKVIIDYSKLEAPSYAIMLSGPWGCGKTYLVKDCLASLSDKTVYVSLYGVDSLDQIKDKIFSALISVEGVAESDIKKAGRFLGDVVKAFTDNGGESSAIGAIASSVGSTVKDRVLKGLKGVTIIFDDLERSSMSQSQALSCVNEFVEHQGVNAIILSDESKIRDEPYGSYKEKVVLYTYKVNRSPEQLVEIAFDGVSGLEESLEQLSRRELTGILENISCKNLRTIKLALSSYTKLVKELYCMRHELADSNDLVALLFPCFAYSVGYRELSISENDLEKYTSDQLNMGVLAHLDKPKEGKEDEGWKRFYNEIVCKWHRSVESLSAYKMICLGYLDYPALLDDLKQWGPQGEDIKSIIVHLNYDVGNTTFDEAVQKAIYGIKQKTIEFVSTQEVISFTRNLHYLISNGAVDYDVMAFEAEISDYIDFSLVEGGFGNPEIPWGVGNDDPLFVQDIAKKICEGAERYKKESEIEELQSCLLSMIDGDNSPERFQLLYNKATTPFLYPSYVSKILDALKISNTSQVEEFRKWLLSRYSSENIFQFLGQEIEGLENLENGLSEIFESMPPSLTRFLLKQTSKYLQSILKTRQRYDNH